MNIVQLHNKQTKLTQQILKKCSSEIEENPQNWDMVSKISGKTIYRHNKSCIKISEKDGILTFYRRQMTIGQVNSKTAAKFSKYQQDTRHDVKRITQLNALKLF